MIVFARARRPIGLLLLSAIGSIISIPPALAHHPMEGSTEPFGVWAGLLSGMAHPLLGPDHLLFLLAIGLVGLSRPMVWVPLLLAAGLGGSALGLLLPGLPASEVLVAVSLVLIALVLQKGWDARLLLPAIAVHGYVLSGTVLGWEATPLAAYLVGLLLCQGVLLTVAVQLVRRWAERASSEALALVRGGLIGIGAAFSWSALVA
ncbi:MAG: HupE/UreJ family protein [Prochlorococcaceae cyanobacterium]